MQHDPQNPYSAPQTDIANSSPKAGGTIHQEDGLLVVPIGTELPDICLISGRRSSGRYFDKKLTWSPPWVFIFILVNLLILLIVYLIVRKQGRLKYYLDQEVVTRMRNHTIFSWVAFPSLIAAIVVGTILEILPLIALPLLTLPILLIVMVVIHPRIRIARIDKTAIYLAKVHPEAMDYILAHADD